MNLEELRRLFCAKITLEYESIHEEMLSKEKEEIYDNAFYISISYIKQDNFQVSRNYTLKMNKKNKDYLQKLMEELKHTEKFSVMQH